MRTARALAVALAVIIAAPAWSWTAPLPEQAGSAPPPTDGIKVHGRWTIEVRNPNGSVAGRYEFNNALIFSGGQILARLLQGNSPRGLWMVHFGTGTTTPCPPASCRLQEPGIPFDSDGALSVAIVGNLDNEVRLTGSLTAAQNGVIDMVHVSQYLNPNITLFSQKALTTPIQVVAGQSIAVTVVYSFS